MTYYSFGYTQFTSCYNKTGVCKLGLTIKADLLCQGKIKSNPEMH